MDTSILAVELVQAFELTSAELGDNSEPDPYVIVRLLPDSNNQLQTRTHRQTRCPYLDERFIFDVASTELASRSLEMRLYDDNGDESRRDECIGQVLLPLDQVDLSDKCSLCKGISAAEKQVSFPPLSLSLSLSFLSRISHTPALLLLLLLLQCLFLMLY